MIDISLEYRALRLLTSNCYKEQKNKEHSTMIRANETGDVRTYKSVDFSLIEERTTDRNFIMDAGLCMQRNRELPKNCRIANHISMQRESESESERSDLQLPRQPTTKTRDNTVVT